MRADAVPLTRLRLHPEQRRGARPGALHRRARRRGGVRHRGLRHARGDGQAERRGTGRAAGRPPRGARRRCSSTGWTTSTRSSSDSRRAAPRWRPASRSRTGRARRSLCRAASASPSTSSRGRRPMSGLGGQTGLPAEGALGGAPAARALSLGRGGWAARSLAVILRILSVPFSTCSFTCASFSSRFAASRSFCVVTYGPSDRWRSPPRLGSLPHSQAVQSRASFLSDFTRR